MKRVIGLFVALMILGFISGCEMLDHAVVLPRPLAEAWLQEKHDAAGWGPACTVQAEWMRAHNWAVSVPPTLVRPGGTADTTSPAHPP